MIMRKKIVAGNWKMNLNLQEGKDLVEGILKWLPTLDNQHRVVIAPPYLHLSQTVAQIEGKAFVYAAAQNCHTETSGAYTGEVSASMLQHTGVSYVILGHSERRQYFGETNAFLAQKVDRALQSQLEVIFCCGEPLEIRDAGKENEYVAEQIKASLFHLNVTEFQRITIAYEPIWAIGTGRTASAQQAQDMHMHIRNVVASKYGNEVADALTILYGGSCNAGNAAELFACKDVDGGLIGGASLKADSFLAIIQAMTEA